MKRDCHRKLIPLTTGLMLALALPAGATMIHGAEAAPEPIKAAVLKSTGTLFLSQTIWRELNADWSQFGQRPVEIDYRTAAGTITPQVLESTGADVLIISAAGFFPYETIEAQAIIDYVEAGHGIIITYHSFEGVNRLLAPLVGLSPTIHLGAVGVINPLQFDLLMPSHPLFGDVGSNYTSGVPFRARPSPPKTWRIDGGTVIANQFTVNSPSQPGIIVNQTETFRGVYFSHYIEDKRAGTNRQDMQVFYNALLWTAEIPEPVTACILVLGAPLVFGRRHGRR